MNPNEEMQKIQRFHTRIETRNQVIERFRVAHPKSHALYTLAKTFLILGLSATAIMIIALFTPESRTLARDINWIDLASIAGSLLSTITAYLLIHRFAIALDTAATTQAIVADTWLMRHKDE